MPYLRPFYSLTLFVTLLLPSRLLGQTQKVASAVEWDEMHAAAADLKHVLETGDSSAAQMRVIQLQLFLAGAPQASEIGEQITENETRPISWNIDPMLSRFIPLTDTLLKAIAESDSTRADSLLGELSSDITEVRLLRLREMRAALAKNPEKEDMTFFNLQKSLERAMIANDPARGVLLATEMRDAIADLQSKKKYISSYAFNLYLVNDALGRAAFLRGDYQEASNFLQKAAEIPSGADGAIMLDTFGPNLWLARQLLQVGKADAVLKFLQTCKERFWLHGSEKADRWIAAIQSGKQSDMAPNSEAGYGYWPK